MAISFTLVGNVYAGEKINVSSSDPKDVAALSFQIASDTDQIKALTDEIAAKKKQIPVIRDQIGKDEKDYRERLVALYETGDVSYLDLLLTSKNIMDFFDKYSIIHAVNNYDNQLETKIKNEYSEIGRSKDIIESDAETIAVTKKALPAIADNLILAFSNYKVKNQPLYNSMVGRYKPDFKYSDITLLWPIQGETTHISSPFGPRIHPITKKPSVHEGFDIADSNINGHPIFAAAAGTVVSLQKNDPAYGNNIVIAHTDVLKTQYGHCSTFANIKVGQHVNKGDVIGYVGSTGESTGPHLHLNVLLNNTYLNPLLLKYEKSTCTNFNQYN